MQTIQANAFVRLDYTLSDEDGDVLDASEGEGGKPIEYVHGYGMLVPGLEAALTGLGVGEERDVVVPAAEGYGDYDDELVLEIDRAELPSPREVEVGDEFVAEDPEGDQVPLEVIEVRDSTVVVDANHPLAGITLHYRVRVRSVREATEEEIAQAAAEFEAAADDLEAELEGGAKEGGEEGAIKATGQAGAPPEGLIELRARRPGKDRLN